MLHHPKVRRHWYHVNFALLAATIVISAANYFPTLAASLVVQGTVLTNTGTPISGALVELHKPDGTFMTQVYTDTAGAYSFTADLEHGIPYVVEARPLTGYNRNEPSAQNFTYQSGDAVRTYGFTMTQTLKTIRGTVTDTTGALVSGAEIVFDPYNVPAASRSSGRSGLDGTYTATVVGGSWFAQANINLSEYDLQWIAEQPPVRVDFANDATVEERVVNFVVTPATGKLSARLLNSDGSALTSSSFVADINFRRTDGVGTARKVRSADSSLSVYLTPGIYSICAFHPDLQNKSFDPVTSTFVMTENGNVDLGTLTAQTNAAFLKGKVVDGAGKGIANVPLLATREAGCERPTGSTMADGTFNMLVGGGTWNLGLNIADPQYSQVTPVTATVTNGQTVDGLKITLKNIDRTISGNVVNTSGQTLTDFVGTAYVQSAAGAKVSTPVVDGAFILKYASADVAGTSVTVGAEATEGSPYTGSSKTKVNITGSTASKNLTVKAYDATLQGSVKLPSGVNASNTGSDITIEAVDENGNYVQADVTVDGAYTMKLAAGTWLFDYDLEHPEDTTGLLDTQAGQNSVTIKSGQTLTKNLTIRQGTNTITGTVKDSAGTIVKQATVNIDNRPYVENSADTKGSQIVSVTAETDASGVYTAKVPNGTFLVTAGDTPAVGSDQLPPDGKKVTISGGKTATANLVFEKSNATLTGKVTLNGKAEGGGTVNAWTDDGASVSAPIKKDGTYTLSVNSGEVWHVEALDLQGSKLIESQDKDINPKAGKNTLALVLGATNVTVPGPVTKSCAADQVCSVSMPDGASVTLPAFAADLSGMIKVTVAPSIDLDKNMTDAPATLAYEVKIANNSGNSVSDLFKPAEITIPYNQSALASNGLVENRLSPSYYDPQTNTWEDSGASGLIDNKSNVATLKTEHLTKFSVTGSTRPSVKVSGFKVVSATKSTAVLEITGSNFKAPMTAQIVSFKAAKVEVKSPTLIKVTFPTAKIPQGKQTLTLTSSNGRQAYVAKTISVVKGVPSFK